MTLFNKVEKAIEHSFPELDARIDRERRVIQIPPQCPEVGMVEIHDEGVELMVIVGNFTHIHIGCYDDLSEQEKMDYIVSDVVNFLEALCSDKIVMWGHHDSNGGCHGIDHHNELPPSVQKKYKSVWVWSGPLEGNSL